MPETPRTWTLMEDGRDGCCAYRVPPRGRRTPIVEVVEKAPVDAERERLLKENMDLTAWASVGRHGICVHSVTFEDCAGCANRNLRRERERLLDLIERVEDWLQVPDYTRYSDLVSAQQVEADVKARLREYGRLGKEES